LETEFFSAKLGFSRISRTGIAHNTSTFILKPAFMTRRQEIMEILRKEPLTVEDLSIMLGVHVKRIFDDMPHIEKSIRPKEKLVITPAQCRNCNFIFKDRRKIRTPSRCPKCKGVHIEAALFQIQDS
jgi:predicted Zn-ribbon and HTH transcriptional regulator